MHQEVEETHRTLQTVSQLRFSSNSAHLSSHMPSLTCSLLWTSRVDNSCSNLGTQKASPSKMSEFRPISSLPTIKKLLGYVWLEAMGDTQFHPFQTGFLRKTHALTEFLSWREQASSRSSGRRLCFWYSWTSRRPLTTSSTPSRPQRCNAKVYPSSCSRYSTSGGPRAALQSAWRESPVTNVSPSAGSTRATSSFRGCFGSHIGTFERLKEEHKHRVENRRHSPHEHCSRRRRLSSCVKQKRPRALGEGMHCWLQGNKTFWTSTARSPTAALNIDGHSIPWAGKITYVCNSGSAMTNRLQKATGVFEKWSSILRDTTLDLTKRILCFRAALYSLGWQKAGVSCGLVGRSFPLTHARSQKVTRGRHWHIHSPVARKCFCT